LSASISFRVAREFAGSVHPRSLNQSRATVKAWPSDSTAHPFRG
jgi:hypothetical protein